MKLFKYPSLIKYANHSDPLHGGGLLAAGSDVSIVGFGMINSTTQHRSDTIQLANLQVRS